MTDTTDRPGGALPPGGRSPATPTAEVQRARTAGSYRTELTRGEETVDPATWAGSVPIAQGIAPRLRGGTKWFNLLWLLPIGFLALIVAVAAAKGLRGTPAVERFIARYPGTLTPGAGAVHGTPLWVGVQHFLNLFLLMFIMRSGLQILSDHPRLYWTRHSTPGRDWFRIQKLGPTRALLLLL